jgi:tricorn protease
MLLPVTGYAETLMLGRPAVSGDMVAFVYAGDIWVANLDGSQPRRLTTSPETETYPEFSPDGSMIAFTANYEGNTDVYVIKTDGGQPQRLTWHPGGDVATGWTNDGQAVTMISAREADHGRSAQFYEVSLDGGLPVKQMEARIFRGVYDDANERLAYIAFAPGYGGLYGGAAGWKGYRGGTTPAVQIMDIKHQTAVTVPGEGSMNIEPFWLGGKVYFVSDRDDKTFNLFSYDPASQAIAKVSNESVWDVKSADGDGSTIVYSAGGRLKRLDVNTGQVVNIDISIAPDLSQLRPQWKDASRAVESAFISPSGKRAVLTARGEVFTVPVKHGSTRNLSNSGERREYSAVWSPDGEQIAYIGDGIKGQTLILTNQMGTERIKSYPLGSYFYELREWTNGDTPRIVYTDNHLNLYVIDLDTGKSRKIATSVRRADVDTAISPDGAWLAYTQEQANFQADLVLYNFARNASTVVTNRLADVTSPAFSPDGQYLYFAASTNSGPLQVGLNMTSQEKPYRAGLYALVLAQDGKSPLLPKPGDEETNATDESSDEKDGDKKGDKDEEKTKPVQIDFAGLADRIVALPVAERNYSNLAVGKDGNLFYIQYVQAGITNEPPGEDERAMNELLRFDFEEKETKSLLPGITGFSLSADGSHILIASADGSISVAEVGDELKPEPLGMSDVRVRVNPREEWRVIFDEVWRMEKEYFYADNMHSLDWQGVYDRFSPLLEHVGRREDLNELMIEMIAEMQVGHNNVGGGDVYQPASVSGGLLGANLQVENGAYRINKIYTGESWNPFLDAPLATPGNEAREGEYILAINGRKLTARDNIFQALQGTVGKQVTLTVGANANGKDSRDIVIEPVGSEGQLRLWSWVENNRRAVEEATDGKVAYVYLPNTAGAGYTFFNRMFFTQVDKQAVIVDERSNGGGQAANYIVEVLSRKHLSGWKDRDGLEFTTPAGAIHGPKVMLIDQDAGSGGDYLPWSFRQLGIGKLLGTRTWGGLIGISANPSLVDGGFLTVPFFRFYDTDGNWTVENEGVAPDTEVALDPIATNAGRDTQLEAAIEHIMSELEEFVDEVPHKAPPLPTELGK